MDARITIFRQSRPKGRRPIWRIVVGDGYRRVFDSARVAIKFWTQEAALSFAELVVETYDAGTWIDPTSYTRSRSVWSRCGDVWLGRSDRDVRFGFRCAAERCATGRVWSWRVSFDGPVVDSSHWPDIQATRLRSAQWLCELFAAHAIGPQERRSLTTQKLIGAGVVVRLLFDLWIFI